MRTDVTINRQQSEWLPNSSTLGYGKYKAQFGDIVLFKEGDSIRVGRVAGKIQHAPIIGDDTDVRGHLVVVALGRNLTHVMERWVNPADVVECFDPEPDSFGGWQVVKLLSFFFGPEFKKQSVSDLRQWANGGTILT